MVYGNDLRKTSHARQRQSVGLGGGGLCMTGLTISLQGPRPGSV